MKVLLVGGFSEGALELSYERVLKAMGLEVLYFELGAVKRFLAPYHEWVVNNNILQVLQGIDPDLILVFKGNYLWPKTLEHIRDKKKAKLFCFLGDSPFDLTNSEATSRNVLEAVPCYDSYFIWTKSLVEPLRQAGAKNIEYLPFGYDVTLHHTMEVSAQEKKAYSSDIVFVGNWDEEREWWLKELLDFDLGIWGEEYWGRRCSYKELRKRWRGQALYGEYMSCALNASRISINILRRQNKDNYNMRTFEAPACGAFVLAERSPEAKEFFEEDKEAVYFSTPQELKDKIRYYLAHEDQRLLVARAGYERCIKSGYSYGDRAKQMLKALEGR
jgi:spore maturation protein CgeB